MKKLLIICGPTATGKTALGIRLAKQLDGEIVSADSRQVYKGMDIGTGKDLPKEAEFKKSRAGGFYEVQGVVIWGYDLVKPSREFSVAQYTKAAKRAVKDIWERDKLPILVGGTGLYIKAVIDGIETSVVPKNKKLREILEKETPKELFERLAQMDGTRAADLNVSDKKNPRRLTRAIEVAEWLTRKGKRNLKKSLFPEDAYWVGLFADTNELCRRIKKRVEKRLAQGFEEEVRGLVSLNKESQAMMSLGYRQWREYFEGGTSFKEAKEKWGKEECKYAKRQMTWFKKDKRIVWFDIKKRSWVREIEKVTQRWYSSSDA